MKGARKTTLGLALQSALNKQLEDGWLYLPDRSTPTANTECLIVGYNVSELEPEDLAASLGFSTEGLDTQTLEDVASCAAGFESPPSENLLVESFIYYWLFDAWLPFPGAPEPPSPEEAQLIASRQFYESLGQERNESPCKASGCSRGAIACSIYCRVHHFEMVRKEPCPFSH
jgi:hypothetical protein